jgi:hypothetical protein
MKDVYKIEISAKDCPIGCSDLTIDFNQPARVTLISSGDVIWMGYDGEIYKLGDKYKDFNAIISGVDYEPKPWWKFWKKKKILGYRIMFL